LAPLWTVYHPYLALVLRFPLPPAVLTITLTLKGVHHDTKKLQHDALQDSVSEKGTGGGGVGRSGDRRCETVLPPIDSSPTPTTAGGRGNPSTKVCPPRLLIGGAPSSFSPESPIVPPAEVTEFSHAGYDGGVAVGFDGTYDTPCFEKLIKFLDDAKEQAIIAAEQGLDGFATTLCGEEILMCAKGGLAGFDDAKGGLIYKYRFFCKGVEFLIHSKPSKHIQPVRVRYGAESIQGHRDTSDLGTYPQFVFCVFHR